MAAHFKRELAPSLNSFQAQSKAKNEGAKSITPYWRTLKMGGVLNGKFPGGADARKKLVGQERHIAVEKGKKYPI